MTGPLLLQLDGEGPRYSQLYRALRAAVLDGRLPAGSRLPSSRALGRELTLSRNTVVEAVAQLVAEGYAVGRQGSGVYVSSELPDAVSDVGASSPHRVADTSAAAEPRLSEAAERALAVAPRGATNWDLRRGRIPFDFRYGEPAYQDFPFETWGRLLGRRMRSARLDDLAYRAPGGHPALREALADYLVRARGARCTADQIVVVSGSQQGVDIAGRMLVDPGDRVALEEPHYAGFRLALESIGATLVGVEVDEHGLVTDDLPEDVRLICVTPSHQFPTGAVLPAARRLALLDWARATGATILEDDYDSEYRYGGRPLACLQGLDESGSVIYAGTFSKVLFPALRTGYVVLPERLVEPFLRMKSLADTGAASAEQVVLAELIAEGHFDRHLRRTRRSNGERRRALVDALASRLGDRVRVSGDSAGLHLMVYLPGRTPAEVHGLRRAALGHGVGIYPTDACYLRPPKTGAFLMGYTTMEPERIAEGVRRLAAAMDETGL